ncbi:MAG TPA: gliding motility-associated C-terminal domain-containing protein [Bacteroidales bacterium]|nr:gliding motility-associated C-terminal domain-containing protein [Bacteroidales bacterium]
MNKIIFFRTHAWGKLIIMFSFLLFFACAVFAQPANDDCANAQAIPVGTYCSYVTYTNTGATYSSETPLPACGSYTTSAADVWFKVTVPASGAMVFDTYPGVITNGAMAIYYGTCNSLTLIECDDNDGTGSMPTITRTDLTPGATVLIRFWEYGGGTYGTFGLCVHSIPQPPACASNPIAGDYCSTAVPICNLNGYCGNTSASYTATVSPTNPADEDNTPLGNVFCGSIENNSWLSFVADSTTSILFVYVSNCSTPYGIQMEVYSTTDCYNFTSVSNCWNPASVVSGTITATGLTVGQTYYLMIDGNAGCVCDYIIAAASGIFTMDAGTDATICEGQSATLNGSGATTYSWSPGAGMADSTIANPVVSPTVTTTYTLTGTGGNPNCPGTTTDVVTVHVNPIPTSDFTVSAPNCINNSATVVYTGNASAGASYLWNFSGGTAIPGTGQGPHIVTWPASGNYDISLTINENNCISTQTVQTVLVSNLSNDTTIYTDVICFGESNGTAAVYPVSGSTPYSYQWSTSPPQTTQTAINLPVGTYYVTITDNVGCIIEDTVQIFQPYALDISIISEDEGCLNSCDGSVNVTVTGGIPPYNYNWTGSALHTPDLTNLCAGYYTVTVTDTNDCAISGSATLMTNSPLFAAAVIDSNTALFQTTISFYFTGNGAVDYFWDFGDGATATVANPVHQYATGGEYLVLLVVTSGAPDFCVDSLYLHLFIPSVKIPNIFTPNGDGINETFRVESKALESEEMIIYNRWGKKIYSWTEVGGEWDGNNQNGQKEADGIYYYIYTAKGKDGKEINFNGTVSLLR